MAMETLRKFVMWLIYGVLIGVTAPIITYVFILPITAASSIWSSISTLSMGVGYIILGWWVA